jgi:hypothetical protein
MQFKPFSALTKKASKPKQDVEPDVDTPVLENPYKLLPVREQVTHLFTEICLAYANGMSMRKVSEALDIPYSQMLQTINLVPEFKAAVAVIRESIAASLVDDVVEYSRKAARGADWKTAGDLALKAAAKLSPTQYGDKKSVELTGKDGGAIRTEVETMTPAEAYKAMLG